MNDTKKPDVSYPDRLRNVKKNSQTLAGAQPAVMETFEKFHQAAYKNRNQGFFLNEHTGEIYEPAAYKEGPTTLIFKAI